MEITKTEYRKFKMICPDCDGSGIFIGRKCTCKNGTRNITIKINTHDVFKDITNTEDWLTKVSKYNIYFYP